MDDEVPTIPVNAEAEPGEVQGVPSGESAAAETEKTYAGLRVLGFAVLMGVLADALLRTRPYGLNIPLWTWPMAASVWLLARVNGRRLSPVQHGLLIAVCIFSAMPAWRSANVLRALDVAAAALALALAVVPESLLGAPLSRAGFLQYLGNGIIAAVQCVGGVPSMLVSDIRWSALPGRGAVGQAKAAVLGILIAVPILIVFGVLLSRADAAFESTLKTLFQFDPTKLVQHTMVFFVATLLSGGLLRLLAPVLEPLVPEEFLGSPKWSLNTLTVCIPLALTNLLFLSFILVQLQQLFGGHAWVQDPNGPTYSEYARRGFIELAMVVSLALPLLFVSDWSLRDAPKGGRRAFLGLSSATLVMLLVISASALHRMLLYTDAYGLTKLRFYTTAFMLWLIVLTLWFAVTILRGRRERFAFGMLVTGLIAIVALNAVNPDLRIAQINLNRAQAGKNIDYDYLLLLSPDAVAAFPPILVADGHGAAGKLEDAAKWYFRKLPVPSGDLRSWNWSRSHALKVVRRAQN